MHHCIRIHWQKKVLSPDPREKILVLFRGGKFHFLLALLYIFSATGHDNVPPEPPAPAPSDDVPETYVIKYTIENTLNYDVKFSVSYFFILGQMDVHCYYYFVHYVKE